MNTPLRVVWDMETGDPDDFLTLLLLLGHPAVELAAVTITPGTPAQVGLVRWALAEFGVQVPVGAFNLDHPKACVSRWHTKTFGEVAPSRAARPGAEVLREHCDAATTLITGGPLKNLGAALELEGFTLGRWVAQGGFAGEGVVPPALQLEKFRGRRTCPTYNLNGDPRAALRALAAPQIGERRFVSKNVCHRVVYDEAFHEAVRAAAPGSRSLSVIADAMQAYLAKGGHKKLHDPLAACCAIDPTIATWAEVELFRERGEWGSKLAPGSNTWIVIDYDPSAFAQVFTARP